MSEVKAVRRAVARLRLDDEAAAIPRIGHRDLHDFWPLLAEAFRSVLLAPHHRSDEDALTWTWREPEEGTVPSAAALAAVREQLQRALESFAGAVASGRMKRGSGAPWLAGGAEQVEAVMGEVVRGLTGRSDPELAGYLCRTEHGWRVHSWGAARPARPTFPDTHGLEISGRVLVDGHPARHDVVLESSDGETIAEVPSDEGGEFVFSRLSPGEYRLRARSVRGTFPPRGLAVDLQRRSVKGLVLADTRTDLLSPLVSARRERARRSRSLVPLVVATLVVAAGGAGYWWYSSPSSSGEPRVAASSAAPTATAAGVVVPVATEAGDGATRPALAALPVSAAISSAHASTSAPALRRELAAEPHASEPLLRRPDGSGAGAAPTGNRPPVVGEAGGSAPGQPEKTSADTATAESSPAQATVASDVGTPAGSPPEPVSASPSAPAAPAPASAATPASAAASGASASASAAEPAAAVLFAASNPPAPIPPELSPASAAPAPAASGRVAAASSAVADEADEVTREADAAQASVPAAVVAAVATGSRTSAASVPLPAAETAATTTVVPPPVSPVRVAPSLGPVAPLTRTVRVRMGLWRPRLLVDTILPTAPLPVTASEPLATLRARLLAEQEARLPQALRVPAARWGVALELGATGAGEGWQWRFGPEARAEAATVTGGRAELLWAATDGVEREFQLVRRDGALVAEVRVAANGRDFTLRTAEETGTWLRLAVGAPDGVPAEAPAYVWRTATTETLPPGWREANEAGTWRAEAPLGGQRGAAALQSCALFDPVSGWAIVMDLRQAADRPLGL